MEREDVGDNGLGNMPPSIEEGDEKGRTTTMDSGRHNLTNSPTTPNLSLVEEGARGPTHEAASIIERSFAEFLLTDYVLCFTLEGVHLLNSTHSRAFVNDIMKDSRVCKGTKIIYEVISRLVSGPTSGFYAHVFLTHALPEKELLSQSPIIKLLQSK